MKKYRFEHVAGFLIGYDGSWHLKITAGNAYADAKWQDVWAGRFVCLGGVAQMVIEVEEEAMARRASRLADLMLKQRFWELKVDVKTT